MSHDQTAPDRKRMILLVVMAVVGCLAAAGLVYQFAGGVGSDASYDKSAENPILPPGVRPGEIPPPGPGSK